MPGKRPRTWNYSDSAKRAYKKRYASAKSSGTTGLAGILRASVRRANAGVKRLDSMIETKESAQVSGTNLSLPHNNIYNTGINPFALNQGAQDMATGTGNRIGDRINVKGVLVKGFIENALNRSKVHYRVMLIRAAKGEIFSRANLFKGIVGNKIIDQMDTERFTVVASKRFTINCANGGPSSVGATGVPAVDSLYNVGIGTKAFSMWIPGKRFGKNGTVQYENNSPGQVKFYDYRVVIMAYDWYGTPQDVNNVGKINDMYVKLYFKDA